MFENMYILSKEQIEAIPDWLPIQGFPKYEVNCRQGIIRSLYTGKILKANPDSSGYPQVVLCKDRKHHTKRVHRIVALTSFKFYGIPTEGLFVLHLDETRTNFGIDNLGLGSQLENMNFEKAKQRLSKSHKGKKSTMLGKHLSAETKKKISEAKKKAVGAYKNGELVMKFESTMEVSKHGFHQGHVSSCCLGKQKVHKGYEWRYLTA